nr:cytochrome c oxidase assembly protein COX19 isoform X1 [Manis javanica]
MSTAMNFGSKSFQPRPPDKGSFPLDHFGECEHFKERFLKCLRDRRFENALCRNESRDYLQCRMDRRVPAGPAAGSAASRQAAGRVGGRRGNLVLSGICIPQRIFFPNGQLMAQEPLEKLGFGDLTGGKSEAKTQV